MNSPKSEVGFDPGSFKDPEGRVCFVDGEVYRTMSASAAARMRELSDDGTLDALVEKEFLVPTRLVTARSAGLDRARYGDDLLHHDRIALITYSYEWSFSMLRDAALLTLDLLQHCLDKGLILKDATAFNIAFHKGRPVFFDALSIDRYEPGAPWDGYAQFCREFLFPLMLASHRGVEFQPWCRGTLNGLPVGEFAKLFGWRDMFRPGVLRHVKLQAKLERSFAGKDVAVRKNFDKSTFTKELILANIAGLRKLIDKLDYGAGSSEWLGYAEDNSYDDEAAAAKAGFVTAAMARLKPRRVADLGCNTGDYSLIAAKSAEGVAALDIDAACIDRLYRRLQDNKIGNVVPIVGNLLNPTPGQGWGLAERSDIYSRIGSDAFLALALVHHICIGGNVPLEAFLDQLCAIAPAGVVEWVGKDDRMVKQMLRNRADVFGSYDWSHFQRLAGARFEIAEIQESHGGARKLCLLLPKRA